MCGLSPTMNSHNASGQVLVYPKDIYGSSGKLLCRNFEYLPGDSFLAVFLNGHGGVNGFFLVMPLECHIIASLNDVSRVRLWIYIATLPCSLKRSPFLLPRSCNLSSILLKFNAVIKCWDYKPNALAKVLTPSSISLQFWRGRRSLSCIQCPVNGRTFSALGRVTLWSFYVALRVVQSTFHPRVASHMVAFHRSIHLTFHTLGHHAGRELCYKSLGLQVRNYIHQPVTMYFDSAESPSSTRCYETCSKLVQVPEICHSCKI